MYLITYQEHLRDENGVPYAVDVCVTMGRGRPKFYRTWLGAWFDVGTLRGQHPDVEYVIHKVEP